MRRSTVGKGMSEALGAVAAHGQNAFFHDTKVNSSGNFPRFVVFILAVNSQKKNWRAFLARRITPILLYLCKDVRVSVCIMHVCGCLAHLRL